MKKFTTILLVSMLILWMFFICYPIKNCRAIIISVDKSGELQYTTIQEAINNATNGDTIYVYSGTYTENIVIDKSIILTGENKQNTILKGSTSGDIIKITSENVQISGFTIKNPIGTDVKCLKLLEAENCIITNNIIQNGNDGIFMINSNNNIIKENTIENNDANGIYAYLCNNNEIYKNTIRNNNVRGIYLLNSNTNLIYQNSFSSNNLANAYDNANNNWNNINKGNYWDDYNNYDSNNDGIGDSPYSISGGSNKDNKPLGYFLFEAYILSVYPNPANVGQTINFQGLFKGNVNIIQWEWKAGSYTVGNQQNCQYSNLPAGSYTITLRVKNNQGVWSNLATYGQKIRVNSISSNNQENHKPTAHITDITPISATYGESIFFEGYGQDEEDSIITSFYWSSNLDGQISTSSSFYKSDLSIGIHNIILKVRDSDGTWSNPVYETINIIKNSSNAENNVPVADAGGPYTGFTNDIINFIGLNSYDSDGIITLYKWSFGDGITDTGSTTNHIYSNPGTYTLNLTVTDDNNTTDTDTTTVTILTKEENNNNNSDDNFFIPGFEMIIIFLALILVLIKKRRIKF
jgi:parallel beta-helix repeat protein